ncbi:MAG: Gfo/Idh/MocA family oxidoreductase [Clostridia bacterium]|nr:Gfo/Idh/MocA family oxidoreductase [Clostridia bacterium]
MDKIKLGIIGVGNMGSSHLRNIIDGKCPEIAPVAAADIDPARLAWAKEQLPGILTFDTADALIHSGAVDAVLIATPHYFHPPMTRQALEAGLHVMSEKPAGVYTKDVRELNEFAKTQDKTFAIMFNQRTNPLYKKMREIVQGGAYGELKRVNWIITDWFRTQFYYNSGSWRATWAGEGGGVLLNQCPHQLDLWQWICGLPCKIRAVCKVGQWHDIEVEDDVTIFAEYPNGATGVFVTTTGDCPGSNRLEITLDRAKLVCENDKLMMAELPQNTSEFIQSAQSGFDKMPFEYKEVACPGENLQHVGVLNEFAAHILHGAPLTAEGAEGIRGLSISNAAFLSSWTGTDVELVDGDDPMIHLEDLFLAQLNERRAASRLKTNVVASVQADMSSTF